MDVRYGPLLRLIHKDVYLLTFQRLVYLSFNQMPIVDAQILPSASGAFMLGKKVWSTCHSDVKRMVNSSHEFFCVTS